MPTQQIYSKKKSVGSESASTLAQYGHANEREMGKSVRGIKTNTLVLNASRYKSISNKIEML